MHHVFKELRTFKPFLLKENMTLQQSGFYNFTPIFCYSSQTCDKF